MTGGRLRVSAITFDFGNTLVRVDRPSLRAVVKETADQVSASGIAIDRPAFLLGWAEERERQFREEVPEFREVDVAQRAVRVLARLRGMTPPAAAARWDDAAAAALVAPGEVDLIVNAYSGAFVDRMAPAADASATLERLAGRGFTLAILSNWPLAMTVDRFAEAHGWTEHLRAIVVSQRVGTIKPHPRIFKAAKDALGGPLPASILHVGDDWAADVVGARQAGWRTAYLRDRQADSPLPSSTRRVGDSADDGVAPDIEIDELAEIDALIDLAGP